MKRTRMIFLFLVLINGSFSQKIDLPFGEKIYENSKYNYANLVIIADSLQFMGDYESSLRINQIKLEKELIPAVIYRIAISYSQLNMTDSAFFYLDQFIQYSFDDRLIMIDKNFDNLRKDSINWSVLIDKIELNYLKYLPDSADKKLALRLFYLGIEDQKYRTFLNNMKQITRDSIGYKIRNSDYSNLNALDSIIRLYGFPTISKVGKLGCENAIMIIQHSDKIKYYFPRYIKDLLVLNEINPLTYALITDRYLMDCHKKQIYGTQLYSNLWTMIWYPGKTILYPVKDFKNVNERRKLIGYKSTVEEYVNRFSDGIIPRRYYGWRKKK